MFRLQRHWLLASVLLISIAGLRAQKKPSQEMPLRIAAAADLQPVLPVLIAEFENSTGAKVEMSYASSATLATQILNGAPYDIFLAANTSFPQRIVDANMAVGVKPTLYARGVLVLWARNGFVNGPLTMQALTAASVHHIAVANPQHAPYGTAAMAAIHSLGLTSELEPKLVYAENIAQAAQFAQSGNAECALISKTLAITPVMQRAGSFVDVPPSSYPPIEQAAVVMRNAQAKQAALAFLNFLGSPSGREALTNNGLQAPTSSPTADAR